MDKMTEDIVVLCYDIFQNLGLEYEINDLNLLFHEQIYFEMYKIMFPFLDDPIQSISVAQGKTGAKLQELIDLLSSSVLTMDLSHIKGDQIAKGDTKHLYYFLQLLFELSVLFKTQNQQEVVSYDPNIKSTPISRNLSERDGEYHRNHSVMGINKEFGDDVDYLQYDQNYSPNMYMQGTKQDKPKKGKVNEPSRSKEQDLKKQNFKKQIESESQIESSSRRKQENDYEADMQYPDDLNDMDPEMAQQYIQQMQQQGNMFSEDDQQQYESNSQSQRSNQQQQQQKQQQQQQQQQQNLGKQIQRSKSTRDLGDKKESDQPANNKQNQMKALEENILSVTQKQHRIITTNPNIATQKQVHREEPQEEEPNLEDISEIDINFLEQVDPEEIAKLPQNHPVLLKYQRELEKLQYLEELQQQQQQKEPDQNIDDVIEAQIYNVKESLKGMREQKSPMDEQKTVEQIIRKKNEYKSFLKDYLSQYNSKQKDLVQHKGRSQMNQQKKMMKIKHDEGDLKKQYDNEHMSMYYKMRDEKLIYLRKIHRIIFELEKRKIIDEKKDHLQLRRQQNVATRNALSSIENAYNDRITMLKDKLRQERQERHVSSVAQRQILSKLERELKGEKIKQIGELKDVYRQEKERFEYLIKDDGQLEQKILQIYKKY